LVDTYWQTTWQSHANNAKFSYRVRRTIIKYVPVWISVLVSRKLFVVSETERDETNTTVSTMVRHKTRWLLVQVDFEKDLCLPNTAKNHNDDAQDDAFPSRKELRNAIRESILQCGGVAASGAALDTQGNLFALFFSNKFFSYLTLESSR